MGFTACSWAALVAHFQMLMSACRRAGGMASAMAIRDRGGRTVWVVKIDRYSFKGTKVESRVRQDGFEMRCEEQDGREGSRFGRQAGAWDGGSCLVGVACTPPPDPTIKAMAQGSLGQLAGRACLLQPGPDRRWHRPKLQRRRAIGNVFFLPNRKDASLCGLILPGRQRNPPLATRPSPGSGVPWSVFAAQTDELALLLRFCCSVDAFKLVNSSHPTRRRRSLQVPSIAVLLSEQRFQHASPHPLCRGSRPAVGPPRRPGESLHQEVARAAGGCEELR